MNLASLKVALRRYGFDDTDPLTTWLNAALHEFEDAYTWPFLQSQNTITIAANDPGPVALPNNFFQVYTLRIEDERYPLKFWDRSEYEDDNPDPLRTGMPSNYTLLGTGQLFLWPIPSTEIVLRLTYQSFVPDLVDPTDVPFIPTRWHYAIVRGAASIGLQAENEEDRAQTAADQFQGSIDRAISAIERRQLGSYGTVRDVQGYADGYN